MPYRVEVGAAAARQIDHFLEYLRRYSHESAEKYKAALQDVFDTYLALTPTFFGYFRETGAPNYAFLFSALPHQTYWIIYRVDEERRIVRVLRFHSTLLDDGLHGL
jgi:plasmid stabilization system protein ParE